MRRREFLAGAAAFAAVSVVQARTLKRIVLLSITPEEHPTSRVPALLRKLGEFGWISGRTAMLSAIRAFITV